MLVTDRPAGEDHRLRDRPRGRRCRADPHRRGARHPAVHLARAGRGPNGLSRLRRLLARRSRLRVSGRPTALRGRQPGGHSDRAPAAAGAGAAEHRPARPGPRRTTGDGRRRPSERYADGTAFAAAVREAADTPIAVDPAPTKVMVSPLAGAGVAAGPPASRADDSCGGGEPRAVVGTPGAGAGVGGGRGAGARGGGRCARRGHHQRRLVSGDRYDQSPPDLTTLDGFDPELTDVQPGVELDSHRRVTTRATTRATTKATRARPTGSARATDTSTGRATE